MYVSSISLHKHKHFTGTYIICRIHLKLPMIEMVFFSRSLPLRMENIIFHFFKVEQKVSKNDEQISAHQVKKMQSGLKI